MINAGYDIKIGHHLLENVGSWSRNCVGEKTKRIALISNPKVFRFYGEAVESSLKTAGFEVFVWLMKDGERFKNFRSLETALKFFSRSKITRTDAAVALGGGVVGDLTGFAAAVYLRGIDFLQIPTTLLSMIDSSVGGKTAVNTEFGKNLVGAFHQPKGVLIDVETLSTLEKREIIAGFCEAVKQGAVAGKRLFKQTASFLEKYSSSEFEKYFNDKKFLSELEDLIYRQIFFKAEIVSQDEKESTQRADARSRKILNFGHTFGHALEKVTEYKYFKHGEAVGYGILFAADVSKRLDILSQNELKLLSDVVHRVGQLPQIPKISSEEIVEAIKFDKKAVNASLQWVLLKGIGKPCILSDQEIPLSVLEKSLNKILQN